MKSNADKMLDKTRLNFGKYKERCYVLWLYNNVEPKRCSKDLALDCEDAVVDNDDPDRYDAHEW